MLTIGLTGALFQVSSLVKETFLHCSLSFLTVPSETVSGNVWFLLSYTRPSLWINIRFRCFLIKTYYQFQIWLSPLDKVWPTQVRVPFISCLTGPTKSVQSDVCDCLTFINSCFVLIGSYSFIIHLKGNSRILITMPAITKEVSEQNLYLDKIHYKQWHYLWYSHTNVPKKNLECGIMMFHLPCCDVTSE